MISIQTRACASPPQSFVDAKDEANEISVGAGHDESLFVAYERSIDSFA